LCCSLDGGWLLAMLLGNGMGEGRTGYVLGEKLFSLGHSLFAAGCEGVPEGFGEDVVVRSGDNGDVASGGVADFSAVAR